jgi:hypothetical protein
MDIGKWKINQDGILSLDLLAGFSIFLFAIITVFALLPSISAGFDVSEPDYDAIAYRTSVILAEYTGDPSNPPWETVPSTESDTISCIGLAGSKQTPCILSEQKVNRLFCCSGFDAFSVQDIYRCLLFENGSYRYNLSVAAGRTGAMIGEPVPEHAYGYARRLIQIRTPALAQIDARTLREDLPLDTYTVSAEIRTRINYTLLSNPVVPEPFRIHPESDPVTIVLTNISDVFAGSACCRAEIRSIELVESGVVDALPCVHALVQFSIDGTPTDPSMHPDIMNAGTLTLTLTPPLPFCGQDDGEGSVDLIVCIDYTFGETECSHPYLSGIQMFGYDSAELIFPSLTPGVLEVCIW